MELKLYFQSVLVLLVLWVFHNQMFGLVFLLICLLLFLVGCSLVDEDLEYYDSSNISEEDLVEALREHGVPVVETKLKDNIFGSTLNKVKPGTYELDDRQLFIYEYKTEVDRDKGLEQFNKNTETMNLVSYTVFTHRNILLFYVHAENLDATSIPYEKDINDALRSFVEG